MHRFDVTMIRNYQDICNFLFANILLKKNIFSIFVNFIRFFYPCFYYFMNLLRIY